LDGIGDADPQLKAPEIGRLVGYLRIEVRPRVPGADPAEGRAAAVWTRDAPHAGETGGVVDDGLGVEDRPAAADLEGAEGAADVNLRDPHLEALAGELGLVRLNTRRKLEMAGDLEPAIVRRRNVRIELRGIEARHHTGGALQVVSNIPIRIDHERIDQSTEVDVPLVCTVRAGLCACGAGQQHRP